MCDGTKHRSAPWLAVANSFFFVMRLIAVTAIVVGVPRGSSSSGSDLRSLTRQRRRRAIIAAAVVASICQAVAARACRGFCFGKERTVLLVRDL